MATTKPTVPDLVIDVTGQTYGGAYWSPAEYRVTLSAESVDLWVVDVADTNDTPIVSHALTAPDAAQLVAVIEAPRTPWAVPGLETTARWVLGDDEDSVTLINELPEIAEWLKYFLGNKVWDPETDGDDDGKWVY